MNFQTIYPNYRQIWTNICKIFCKVERSLQKCHQKRLYQTWISWPEVEQQVLFIIENCKGTEPEVLIKSKNQPTEPATVVVLNSVSDLLLMVGVGCLFFFLVLLLFLLLLCFGLLFTSLVLLVVSTTIMWLQ